MFSAPVLGCSDGSVRVHLGDQIGCCCLFGEGKFHVIDQWRTNLRLCDSGLGISESRFFCCKRRAMFHVFIKCEEKGPRAMN